MSKPAVFLLILCGALRAGVRTMTLRETVAAALRQHPDPALARMDEAKTREAVRIARDPFFPKLAVGSGLAYSNGFPMGIEGSSPIILQAQQFIFNRQQTYLVAQSREEARGATLASAGKRDEMAFRGVRDMRGASPPRGPCAATGCGLI